jgi:hypothetical protein
MSRPIYFGSNLAAVFLQTGSPQKFVAMLNFNFNAAHSKGSLEEAMIPCVQLLGEAVEFFT